MTIPIKPLFNSNQYWVSYSEISDWRQCKLKHELGYGQRWGKPTKSRPLTLGIAWHNVMEAHYRGDEERVLALLQPTHNVIKKGVLEGLSPGGEDFSPILQWMYAGHCKVYGAVAADEPFDILEVEETHLIPLPNPTTHVTHVKIKMDLVIEDERGVIVRDHKSGSGDPTSFHDLELDSQFALYVWGARELGYKCRWAERSYARTKPLKTKELPMHRRFEVQPIPMRPSTVNTAIAELQADLTLMGHQTLATRSPTKDWCSWKCDFREPCQASYTRPSTLEPTLLAAGFEQGYRRD